jgi:DNA-binding CsgD family transcriptional regulator
MYERHAYECYLTGQVNEAIEARRAALALYQAQGNRVREGDNHRWLSRLLWFNGDREGAMREARRAVEMLEAGPAGRELAMAYSTQAQMSMLASDSESAILSGQRAIELAERLRETETLVHALNNVGAAELHRSRRREGGAMLERSLAIAHNAELEEHVARAYTNLGAGSVRIRDLATADRNLAAGVAYCQEHDLDAWWLYMTGWMAYSHLIQGRWDMAVDHALAVLRREDTAVASGEWAAAARAWEKIGCPYEAALARAESGVAARKREALAALQRLGALPAARAIAQRLREQGITGVGRGPRRSTIEHPAQLTSRQVELLALLGDRLTNAEIAERLYISPKTVDHHVSAILGKLGVHSRRAAAAEAARLGVLT